MTEHRLPPRLELLVLEDGEESLLVLLRPLVLAAIVGAVIGTLWALYRVPFGWAFSMVEVMS